MREEREQRQKSWFLRPRYSPLGFLLFSAFIFLVVVCFSGYLVRSWFMLAREAVLAGPLPRVVIAPRVVPGPQVIYQKAYDFTRADAFSWDVPLWEKVMAPYRGRAGLNYLEVGLYEGRSSLWMLEQVLTAPDAHLTGIDLFDGALRDTYFANLRLSGLECKATIINQPSGMALKALPAECFDLIYIDGSHVKCNVLEDAVLAWPLLKKGGLLIFDDYGHIRPSDEPEQYEAPKVAIDAWYTCFDHRCEVLHNEWQVIIRKTR